MEMKELKGRSRRLKEEKKFKVKKKQRKGGEEEIEKFKDEKQL